MGMITDNEYKEVYFGDYCPKCKYFDLSEDKEPCNECLSEPTNLYSHKPIKFEKASKRKNKRKENKND